MTHSLIRLAHEKSEHLYMRNIFYKLLLGKPEYNFGLPHPAIKNQCLILKRIWNNELHDDVGLEKLLRLFLASIQFIFPAIYMRHMLWRAGYMYQTLAIELYVTFKIALPIILLVSGLYVNKLWVGIIIYLLVESLCYIAALIFISDQLVKPRSYKRSILLLVMDYVLIALDFAVIYGGLHLLGEKYKNALDCVYFSFVTSATIGYGEIVPVSSLGKLLVCFQSIIFFVFVVVIINLFSSRIGNELRNYEITNDKKV
jgi:hypothetical protein